MIIPDVNLLIYAHNCNAPDHDRAKAWFLDLMEGEKLMGLPWFVICGFVRIATHPKVLEEPVPVAQAVRITRSWLARKNVRIIEPGSRFSEFFFTGLDTLGTAGNLTTDAYLAALAIEHQAELHSCDTDFHRFSGLRWKNPLAK